jgi:CBS domain-containing protein
MALKVEDMMVKNVITIESDSSVKQAAESMNKYEIGCLIVCKKGDAVGIVTERDLLKRVVAKAKDVKTTRVKEIMSSPLITVKPATEVEDAVKLMFQTKIKKLPVINDRKHPIGLVTSTDIARFQPYLMKIVKQLNARTHLLTETERQSIKNYMEKGEKDDDFETLVVRCRKMQALREELDLINRFLAKTNLEI